VNPLLLETMDKLRFDCYRVGMVKEHMDEMEPVVRNSHMVMFDVNAIRHSDAPSNYLSPNGLSGEEACIITRNVGMSTHANTFGIFGYNVQHDSQLLTARQISQMLWYLLDGKAKGKQDAPLSERDSYFEFHTAFGEVDTVFLQSKRTGRWWMQLPDHTFIACSYNDYLQASSNEIPERYLRALERS
jgi:formiminoglutamase